MAEKKSFSLSSSGKLPSYRRLTKKPGAWKRKMTLDGLMEDIGKKAFRVRPSSEFLSRGAPSLSSPLNRLPFSILPVFTTEISRREGKTERENTAFTTFLFRPLFVPSVYWNPAARAPDGRTRRGPQFLGLFIFSPYHLFLLEIASLLPRARPRSSSQGEGGETVKSCTYVRVRARNT